MRRDSALILSNERSLYEAGSMLVFLHSMYLEAVCEEVLLSLVNGNNE